jgi:outer membrane receptor protein involved in Fe transport
MVHAFLLALSVAVSGVVVDQRGQPLSHARVRLTRTASPSVRNTFTDAKGAFRFDCVAPGVYRLQVEASAFRPTVLSIEATASGAPVRIALEPSALTVIGSVTGHARAPFNTTPVSQRVFPREAYRDQAQPSISSVLDQTPGAFTSRDVTVNAAVPNAPAFATVRGGLPFETLAQLDGVPISLPSNGSFDLSLIPSFVLGDVEVVKGPGDVSGGGGSVGGAVNFRTAEPTAARRATPEIEGDSQGGQYSDIAYDGTLPGGKVAFASMLSIDGAPGPTRGAIYPVEGTCCSTIAGDDLRRALLLDVRLTPSPALTFTATTLAVNLDRALAATQGFQFASDAASLAPSLNAREDDRLRFDLLHAQYGAGNDSFEARGYDLNLVRDLNSSVLGAGAEDSEFGGTLGWTHAIAANRYTLQLDGAGASASSDDAYATPLAPGSGTTSLRLRAAATFAPTSRDRIDLAYETNFFNARFAPDGAHFVARAWSPANARAGYAHEIKPGLALRASIGTSGVAPPLGVLSGYPPSVLRYSGWPAQIVSTGSTVTALERANGIDAGVEWRLHGDTTTISAGIYGSQTQGAYVERTSGNARGAVRQIWFNGPPMTDDGIEASIVQFKRVGLGFIAQLALPRTYVRGPLNPSFYAGGNLAILPGQNVAGGAFFAPGENDVAAVRVPYAQGYAELSYKWPRGSRASIGALYLGSNNAYGRAAFATMNANIEISAGGRGKLQFSVENLTDALDARLPVGFGGLAVPLANGSIGATNANALAPRTIRFMYRQSFGSGSIYER